MRARCAAVCDAAWSAGIRWFDAARSYGRAEEFLGSWLGTRGIRPDEVTVSSKWGYTYTAGWRTDATVHEVKDHSSGALERQWPESAALLGPWLHLYQVHSATPDSGVLDDQAVRRRLAALGLPVGLSLSGPHQADTLLRALTVEVDGQPLFSAVQATWNLLEPSAAPALAEAKAAGWTVIVKEALANGRLAAGPDAVVLGERPDAVALACALAQPWTDVVLSGAASVEQLVANVGARDLVGSIDPDKYAHLASEPARYWSDRAAMPWT